MDSYTAIAWTNSDFRLLQRPGAGPIQGPSTEWTSRHAAQKPSPPGLHRLRWHGRSKKIAKRLDRRSPVGQAFLPAINDHVAEQWAWPQFLIALQRRIAEHNPGSARGQTAHQHGR